MAMYSIILSTDLQIHKSDTMVGGNGGHERIFTSDYRPDGTTDLVEIFDKKAWLKRGSNWGRLSGSLVP